MNGNAVGLLVAAGILMMLAGGFLDSCKCGAIPPCF